MLVKSDRWLREMLNFPTYRERLRNQRLIF